MSGSASVWRKYRLQEDGVSVFLDVHVRLVIRVLITITYDINGSQINVTYTSMKGNCFN